MMLYTFVSLQGKNLLQTLYESCIINAHISTRHLSTTIGFGDLTPTKVVSKFVACIFIPIAVASMGYILGNVASHIVEKRRAEYVKKLWSSQIKLEDIEALDEAEEGGINELEYIKFMLVAMKKIDADLFDDLHDQFNDVSKYVHNIVLCYNS